ISGHRGIVSLSRVSLPNGIHHSSCHCTGNSASFVDQITTHRDAVPDEDSWKNIAREFFSEWDFPLCVGAIDGKHIRIKAPRNAGSKYFNYKGFHSVVLMAVSDARGRFIVIDVGAYGSCSDGGIIQDSTFYKLVKADKLNVPKPSAIPGTDIEAPHVFAADEAFP
ncbi:nuclease harbi1, partial [Elysia marginata]